MVTKRNRFRCGAFVSGVLGLGLALVGCNNGKPAPQNVAITPAQSQETDTVFTDTTQEAGVSFRHVNGAFGKKWLPETMGSGLAWIDYDGDGLQDLFFVNSRDWTPQEKALAKTVSLSATGATGKLFHNEGGGKFKDTTAQAKLNVSLYGMGVCVGDYDNDGRPDLYVTGLGRNYLFRNTGGAFQEVAAQMGVQGSGWSTSAAWLDYDKDGKLDLVVGRYVQWTPASDLLFPRNGHPTYGTPGQYVGEPLLLFHNEGGKFKEVAAATGLAKNTEGRPLQGKTLGIAICDYNNDSYPDIAVANDTEPTYFFVNQKDGKFKDDGIILGLIPETGVARGAMGIDACDYDAKGKESLIIGNFSNQGLNLYHNEGLVFRDVAQGAGIYQPSLLSLTFGCFFFDMNNDGWRDIFIGNGHVDDDVQEVQKEVEYAQKPHLFRNNASGSFVEVTEKAGSPMNKKYVSRGAAFADYELTGNVGIAISTNNGPAHLFRNQGGKNRSLRLELEGVKSNRSAIGAVVKATLGDKTQVYTVRSGSSYCSQSELPLTIGLGSAEKASFSVVWPSGETTDLPNLEAGQIYHIVEGKGVADKRPYGQPIAKRTASVR